MDTPLYDDLKQTRLCRFCHRRQAMDQFGLYGTNGKRKTKCVTCETRPVVDDKLVQELGNRLQQIVTGGGQDVVTTISNLGEGVVQLEKAMALIRTEMNLLSKVVKNEFRNGHDSLIQEVSSFKEEFKKSLEEMQGLLNEPDAIATIKEEITTNQLLLNHRLEQIEQRANDKNKEFEQVMKEVEKKIAQSSPYPTSVSGATSPTRGGNPNIRRPIDAAVAALWEDDELIREEDNLSRLADHYKPYATSNRAADQEKRLSYLTILANLKVLRAEVKKRKNQAT